jgi:hypothetical protein
MDWETEQSSKMEWEAVGHFNNLFDLENFLTSDDELNYSTREGDFPEKYL